MSRIIKPRVLVGCECSQVVTAAFRAVGCESFSCDIKSSYGAFPEYHFQGDLREVFAFVKPDLLIAHPPCTYLANSGSCRLIRSDGSMNWLRYELGLQARDFFLWCLSRRCKVCVENPVPSARFALPPWSQCVHPFFFGDPYTKRTCLWLRGLPLLQMTAPVKPSGGSWVNCHYSARIRSETFKGLAAAMAAAWSSPYGFQLEGGWCNEMEL